MKKIILLIIILGQIIFSQKFDTRSNKLNLNIKFPPPDTIKPLLKINKPSKLPYFPIYSIDSIYTIKGTVEDNSGKVKIRINEKLVETFTNGPYSFDVKLSPGSNILIFDVFDKRENHYIDTLEVIQDSKADISPPIIKIIEPNTLTHRGIKIVPKYLVSDSLFYLRGKVSDENDLMGIWINKISIDSLYDDQFQFNFPGGAPDSITIEAADRFGNLTTETYYASDITSDSLDSAPIKYHALIIAVQDYKDRKIESLENPIPDGDKLKKVLTEDYTFKPENIYFLKNPSRSQILSEFQRLRKSLTQYDNLLIFYAGHGYLDKEIQQGYWLPVDAKSNNPSNWLTNSEIKDAIRGIKTKHTLLITDACFAGNFFRGVESPQESEIAFQALYQYQSRKAITSGNEENKVLDKSVFVKQLIKKLSDNKEQYWESQRLYLSIRDAVRYNTPNNQSPLWGVIEETGDEGYGDFIFIHK